MSALHDASLPTVAYWAIRGLGAPLRMMVMYSGQRFNCKFRLFFGYLHIDC